MAKAGYRAQSLNVLTTGEVAAICQAAPRTVSKWFDSGKLKGYRIPGSKDRRIPVANLVAFMRSHGYDERMIPDDDHGPARILFVGFSAVLAASVGKGVEAKFAADLVLVGEAVAEFKPHVVAVDLAMGRIEAAQIAHACRRRDVPCLAFGGSYDDALGLGYAGHVGSASPMREIVAAACGLAGKVVGKAAVKPQALNSVLPR